MGGYPCCCNDGGCITGTINAEFTASIPGNWHLSYGGPVPTIVAGKLEKEANGVGDSLRTGPCIQDSVFTGPFAITAETQLSNNLGPGSQTATSGIEFSIDGTTFYFFRQYTAFNFEALIFRYTLDSGGGTVSFDLDFGDFGTVFANGDILRMEIDGEDEEVEEVRCYFNGVLVHTETFFPAEPLGDFTSDDVTIHLVFIVDGSSGGQIEQWEYFRITL